MPVKKKEPKKYEIHIHIGETLILLGANASEGMSIHGNNTLNGDELAAIAIINELLRKLKRGRPLEYDYDPLGISDPKKIVTCKWLASGNLKIDTTTPMRRYNHSVTVEQALSRPGSFTCRYALALLLPRRRVCNPNTENQFTSVTDTNSVS